MSTRFPVGYGTHTLTLQQMHDHYIQHNAEPEYWERLFGWLAHTNGHVGIGAAWRGTPNSVSAASRAGHSFHQSQKMADGTYHFMAVDVVVRNPGHVHRAPHANEVPVQGSAEAAHWGIHANVGHPGTRGFESWHLQAVEMDGYQRWVSHGRPRPDTNFGRPHGHVQMAAPAWLPSTPPHHEPRATMQQDPSSHSADVKLLQVELRTWHHSIHAVSDPGAPDSRYGPRVAWSVATWQREVGKIHADGVFGPATAAKWSEIAEYLNHLNPEQG
jgi:hypothetical protein